MKLSRITKEKTGNRVRITASVSWEDNDLEEKVVFFETEEEFGSGLTSLPHPFVVGCLLPAFHHGEKRLAIDGPLCPELEEGLDIALHWLRHWYYDPHKSLPVIESKEKISFTNKPARAGFFFTGGIDSLATLRANRLHYPPDHPRYIKDGIIIYGQNIESDTHPDTFKKAVSILSDVTKEADVTLMPIYTNIRHLEAGRPFFDIFLGAILAASAHAMSNYLTSVSIAASDDIPTLTLVNSVHVKPYGSHPLIDPNYSSTDLRVIHEGLTRSRLDKTRMIAQWEAGLHNIKVCGPNWPGENCGRCEKCVRTMLALLAVDSLAKSNAFPDEDVSPDMIAGIHIGKPKFGYSVDDCYLELINPLLEKGRRDLVEEIQKLIDRSQGRQKKGIRSSLRKIDQKYLHGFFRQAKSFIN